jgi:hypothetical protein
VSASGFSTNPVNLGQLLKDCHTGKIQLPDFQRSWVWDEDRIISLINSIARGFPVGAIMTLKSGGDVRFKPRPIEGAPISAAAEIPSELLLDGQQRLTSMYQVTLRDQVVETVTPRKRKVKRWFYFDMRKAVSDDPQIREKAVVAVGEDKTIRSDFGKKIDVDLRTQELEFENLMFPLNSLFDSLDWSIGFTNDLMGRDEKADRLDVFKEFSSEVIQALNKYDVPVISLNSSTSKEAVCVVFEKVNTGGKALDAFELITAIYAADGYELRKDWYGDGTGRGRLQRFKDFNPGANGEGILSEVGNTDFLHVISLFHTRDMRREAEIAGKTGNELPQIIGNRAALLDLPLHAYKKYQTLAEEGFVKAAKFLTQLNVFRVFDLPYQSQLIPLAAILADLGYKADFAPVQEKLRRWYWCGVFGELYGSTTETRIAQDFVQVPAWLDGGPEPRTLVDASFQASRLQSMRMRLSAAYKGVNALLMNEGARDFISDMQFAFAVFFNENVDIHHIFPKKWCQDQGISASTYDSIINKSPLSSRSNQMIGGIAPSQYLNKLENGWGGAPGTHPQKIDDILRSHLIDPSLLRSNRFDAFFQARQSALLELIEQAMGKSATRDIEFDEGADLTEAELVLQES